jgi:hypothetical protein
VVFFLGEPYGSWTKPPTVPSRPDCFPDRNLEVRAPIVLRFI